MNTTKLEESKNKIAMLKEHQHELLQENEDAFAEVVKTLTVQQIDEMTDEEILTLNNYAEGEYYIAEPEFETREELAEYVRQVIRFLVQSYEFTQEMDEKIKELNQITEETNAIIAESLGLNGDVSSVEIIKRAIENGLEKAKEIGDEVQYNNILQSQKTFEESFTLERMKKLYKELDSDNLKEDARSERSVTIYKNYLRVQQMLGSQYDLINVNDLEVRFLPEEYHEMNNLFIIATIKYISKTMKDGYYSSDTAFFVSQLTTNLFMLHLGKLPEEYKEVLLTNIKEFLDIVR